MPELNLCLVVENSDTILSRVIETVKRRRIPIIKFHAEICADNDSNAKVDLKISTDDENKRLLKKQLEKLIDVIEVRE